MILFTEDFADNNFASRGWFDTTTGTIDTGVFSPNAGNSSLNVHWNSSGTTPSVNPPKRKGFTASETIYVSVWLKFGSSGTPWQGSGETFHPHIFYILSDADDEFGGLSVNYLTVYIEAGSVVSNNARPRILIQDNLRIDTGNLDVNLLGTAAPHSVAGYNGHQDQATPTLIDTYELDGFHNYTQWDSASNNFTNNTWKHVAFTASMNSIQGGLPQANGVLKYLIDGSPVVSRNNVYLRTAQYATQKFKTFVIAPYIGDGSPIGQDMWIDNLEVHDSEPGGFYQGNRSLR